eukprot:1715368-Prymnesium_polylepis.1
MIELSHQAPPSIPSSSRHHCFKSRFKPHKLRPCNAHRRMHVPPIADSIRLSPPEPPPPHSRFVYCHVR